VETDRLTIEVYGIQITITANHGEITINKQDLEGFEDSINIKPYTTNEVKIS